MSQNGNRGGNTFFGFGRKAGSRIVDEHFEPAGAADLRAAIAGAIESAKKTYRAANLSFAVGDATRWEETIGRERFDCIVAFDMIEHVRHREILMQNVVEHLAPGGRLLLSTPCAADEIRLKPEWVFHRIEYSSLALYDFLRRYFARIVRPEDAAFPHREVFDLLSEGPVTYALKMNPIVCEEPVLVENPYSRVPPPET